MSRSSFPQSKLTREPFTLGLLALLVWDLTGGCARIGYGSPTGDVDGSPGPDSGVEAGPPDSGVPLCGGGECRRVFVTSVGFPTGAFGGLAQGDAFCQQAADAAGLGGTWLAWLSAGATSAASRLAHATVPYVLLDGTPVANDWSDLADGNLAHAIDLTELVTPPGRATGEVWTGTSSNGGSSGSTCASWTNGTAMTPFGTAGVQDATNADWTNAYPQYCDRSDLGLYCFEQ